MSGSADTSSIKQKLRKFALTYARHEPQTALPFEELAPLLNSITPTWAEDHAWEDVALVSLIVVPLFENLVFQKNFVVSDDLGKEITNDLSEMKHQVGVFHFQRLVVNENKTVRKTQIKTELPLECNGYYLNTLVFHRHDHYTALVVGENNKGYYIDDEEVQLIDDCCLFLRFQKLKSNNLDSPNNPKPKSNNPDNPNNPKPKSQRKKRSVIYKTVWKNQIVAVSYSKQQNSFGTTPVGIFNNHELDGEPHEFACWLSSALQMYLHTPPLAQAMKCKKLLSCQLSPEPKQPPAVHHSNSKRCNKCEEVVINLISSEEENEETN